MQETTCPTCRVLERTIICTGCTYKAEVSPLTYFLLFFFVHQIFFICENYFWLIYISRGCCNAVSYIYKHIYRMFMSLSWSGRHMQLEAINSLQCWLCAALLPSYVSLGRCGLFTHLPHVPAYLTIPDSPLTLLSPDLLSSSYLQTFHQ